MENNDYLMLEKYADNQLSAAEKTEFEQRLQTESALREELRLHQLAVEAVRVEGRKMLKNRLQSRQISPRAPVFFSRKMGLVCGFLAVAGFFFLWKMCLVSRSILQKPTEPSESPKTPESIEKTQIDLEIAQNQVEIEPKAPRFKNTKAIFSANFHTFKPDELASQVRGEDNDEPFSAFVNAYLKSENEAALVCFEKLSAEDKSNLNILFFKANSLLAVGKTDAAILIFEKILTDKTARYAPESRWFLSLAYLKKDNLTKAKLILKTVAVDATNRFQKEAKEVLEKI
jgi:tetratricopeptide (TPR) repeat protein